MYSPARLALEVARGAREEAEVVGGERHLVARDHQRLADVARLDLRELLGVVGDDVRELEQQLGALAGRRVEPLGQRLLRALDRRVDLVRRHVRHVAIVSPVAGLRRRSCVSVVVAM